MKHTSCGGNLIDAPPEKLHLCSFPHRVFENCKADVNYFHGLFTVD